MGGSAEAREEAASQGVQVGLNAKLEPEQPLGRHELHRAEECALWTRLVGLSPG